MLSVTHTSPACLKCPGDVLRGQSTGTSKNSPRPVDKETPQLPGIVETGIALVGAEHQQETEHAGAQAEGSSRQSWEGLHHHTDMRMEHQYIIEHSEELCQALQDTMTDLSFRVVSSGAAARKRSPGLQCTRRRPQLQRKRSTSWARRAFRESRSERSWNTDARSGRSSRAASNRRCRNSVTDQESSSTHAAGRQLGWHLPDHFNREDTVRRIIITR